MLHFLCVDSVQMPAQVRHECKRLGPWMTPVTSMADNMGSKGQSRGQSYKLFHSGGFYLQNYLFNHHPNWPILLADLDRMHIYLIIRINPHPKHKDQPSPQVSLHPVSMVLKSFVKPYFGCWTQAGSLVWFDRRFKNHLHLTRVVSIHLWW